MVNVTGIQICHINSIKPPGGVGLGISVLSSWPFNTSKQGRVDMNRTSTRRWSYMRNAQIPFWVSYFTRETKSWSYQKEKQFEKEQFLRACRKPWAGWEAIIFLLVPSLASASFHVSHLGPSRGFQEKVGIPKKTRCTPRELRPYQVTLEKASLKLGKDWQKSQ